MSPVSGVEAPPSSNTGVCPPSQSHYVEPSGRFDWYAATITQTAPTVVAALADRLGAVVQDLDKSMNGYTHQSVLRRDGDVVARVLYGGNGGSPHAFASGEHSQEFAAVVRGLWPDTHRVSRCDVSTDFDDGPGTFESFLEFADRFALEHNVQTSVAGDWRTPGHPGGRTLYVGSRKSAVFVRIYEKGKEIRARLRLEDADAAVAHISETLVRVELVVRPEKDARYVAARMQPMEGYGFAVWSQRFGSELFGLEVPRVTIKHVRDSDDERAFRFMVKQYSGVLSRLVEDRFDGSWEALGVALGKRVENGASDAHL